MNILLVNVPSRKGEGGIFLPLGLLYVGDIIERSEHKAKIIDMYFSDLDALESTIAEFKPDIVGFGGIASSYGGTKRLSLYIKEKYPNILQIAGGPLASTYDILLANTNISVVFHGEADFNLPLFLKRLSSGEQYNELKGVSYLSEGKVVKTPPEALVTDIDELPYPAYHLVDVQTYAEPISNIFDSYKLVLDNNPKLREEIHNRIDNKKFRLPILASRGCTNRCFFCYRHVFGHRQHSVGYVINHIKFIQKNYGISGFLIGDELFNRNREWVLNFCDAIEREKLDIFYTVAGARIDMTDEHILRRLKQTGCIEIYYGQESGSDIVLKEYRKGVSRQQNKEITILTQQLGFLNIVQLVIGSPSETTETVNDTISFLKECGCFMISLNYLIPLPETLSWQYVMKHGLIKDVEKYYDEVAEYGGTRMLVNLTKEPDAAVKSWYPRICYEATRIYYKTSKKMYMYALYTVLGGLRPYVAPWIPAAARKKIRKFLERYGLRT